MAKYFILFGLDEPEITKSIVNTVKSQKNEVEFACRTTKESIREFLSHNPSVTTIVLREIMDAESFSADELAALNDTKTYNIIVVVDASHKGTDFMQKLYSAGITSAILIDSSSGASPSLIANLVLTPRSRRKARDVYGMNSVKFNANLLTSDMYLQNYALLMNESVGFNVIDRYLIVLKKMSVKQGVEFTKKLPPNVLRELMQYEEYYTVLANFGKYGYKFKVKKPKNVKKGLSDEAFREAMYSRKSAGRSPAKKNTQINRPPAAEKAVAPVKQTEQKKLPINNTETPAQPQEPVPAQQNNEMLQEFDITKNYFAEDTANAAQKKAAAVKPQPADVTQTKYGKAPKLAKTQEKGSRKIELGETGSAFNKGKKKVAKPREKKKINWKLLLMILIAGILCLVIWYFMLLTMQLQ